MGTKVNMKIDQGATFSTVIDVNDDNGEPLNLDGYSANAAMRRYYASTNAVVFEISLETGKVTLSMNSATTANLTFPRYVYDVILTDTDGNVTRILEGIVQVAPRVSR